MNELKVGIYCEQKQIYIKCFKIMSRYSYTTSNITNVDVVGYIRESRAEKKTRLIAFECNLRQKRNDPENVYTFLYTIEMAWGITLENCNGKKSRILKGEMNSVRCVPERS